jgi:hypothetical protein
MALTIDLPTQNPTVKDVKSPFGSVYDFSFYAELIIAGVRESSAKNIESIIELSSRDEDSPDWNVNNLFFITTLHHYLLNGEDTMLAMRHVSYEFPAEMIGLSQDLRREYMRLADRAYLLQMAPILADQGISLLDLTSSALTRILVEGLESNSADLQAMGIGVEYTITTTAELIGQMDSPGYNRLRGNIANSMIDTGVILEEDIDIDLIHPQMLLTRFTNLVI